ncbi:hypothetical protein MYX76_14360 [Desulfobacterota bacterium AH_259_B03_O07]|nr:hypothetical protein [Desulfobacterota bacterium AH_259_B03_O07]
MRISKSEFSVPSIEQKITSDFNFFLPLFLIYFAVLLWYLSELLLICFNDKNRGIQDFIASTIVIVNNSNYSKIDLPIGRIVKPRDYIIAWFFLAIWILPVLFQGLTKQSLYFATANRLEYFYYVACLFTKRVGAWSNFYVQVLPIGSNQWVTLEDKDYSPMKPFGHRARIDRILVLWSNPNFPDKEKQVKEMSLWLKKRYAELNPDSSGLEAIRYIRIAYPVGGYIAKPSGHWRKEKLETIPENKRYIFASYDFNDNLERK